MRGLVSEEKIRSAMVLYPGKTKKEVESKLREDIKKRLQKTLMVTGLLLAMSLILLYKERKEGRIQALVRPGVGMEETVQTVQIETADGWRKTEVSVSAVELEEEQIDKLHQETEAYLDTVVAGENENLQRVECNLYFPDEVLDSFEVSWSTDALWLLDVKGEVHNDGLTEEKVVTITAKIEYGTEFRVYERRVVVCPKEYTQEEKLLLGIEEELIKLEETSRTQKEVALPEMINGRKIQLLENKGLSSVGFLGILAVLLPVFVYQNYFSEIEKKKKDRADQARNGYTEFVTKLSLMLVAGVSVREAFGRLAKEYAKTYGNRFVLTEELQVTCRELENGCPEAVAYEAFGDRFGQVAYQRMASLLSQNATKGVQNIRELLLQEAKEVMAEERTKIKIRGEQTGTKLLLPMMGFLVLIFAVLLMPAFGMF